MTKKLSRTSVKELKEIVPMADTFEFKRYMRYIIKVRKSAIIGGSSITPAKIQELKEWVLRNDLEVFLLEVEDNDIKIYELKSDK